MMFSLPSVKMPILRMGYHNIGPLSVNQPVLRMGYPNLALLSVKPVILRMGHIKPPVGEGSISLCVCFLNHRRVFQIRKIF